jgi:hypothetical protein|tara:strand:+ start:36 stop:1205 length:1170 start_codon:yes stop_codon:yes gene_type:complete
MALNTVSSDRLSTNVKNTNFTAAEKQDLTDDILPLAGQLGNRNLIINGAMQVAQRGTSFTSVTASAYHLDRFQYNLNGTVGAATVTQNTVTDLAGFTKSLKVDCTTADASLAASDRLTLRYAFEGQDLQQVAKGTSSAKQLTLSFYIKATKTGTQIVELFDHDNTRHCAKSVTISQSNTWEKKTITYPADTTGALDNDNANSISIFFGVACGTDFTSGTLATAWAANTNANRFVGQVNHFDNTANNFEITGVQLEVGSVATDFEFKSFAQELALCQRYFQQYSHGTYRGFPFSGRKSSNNTVVGTIHGFPPMRAAAAGSIDDLAGFKIFRFSDGSTTTPTNLAITHEGSVEPFTDLKFTCTVSSFASTGNMCGIFTSNTSGEFTLDAEI